MATQEQKELCIKLYTEGKHTVKEIVSEAGLRYAPDLYAILKEANISLKNRRPTKQITISVDDEAQKIISEYGADDPSELIAKALNEYKASRHLLTSQRETFLLSLCRLYHGEAENPISKEKDAFKHYMWRNERRVIEMSGNSELIRTHQLEDPRNWTMFFRNHIKAYIELWVGSSNKKEASRWLDKYFNYRK